MVIVLEGKLGVEKNSMGSIPQPSEIKFKGKDKDKTIETIDPSHRTAELFEKLTVLAKRERDKLRRSNHFQRKNSLPVSHYELMLPVLTETDFQVAMSNLHRRIDANAEFGGRERLVGSMCHNRVFSLEPSTLLVIEMNFLFYWLEAAFKQKLNRNVERIKKIAAFQQVMKF